MDYMHERATTNTNNKAWTQPTHDNNNNNNNNNNIQHANQMGRV